MLLADGAAIPASSKVWICSSLTGPDVYRRILRRARIQSITSSILSTAHTNLCPSQRGHRVYHTRPLRHKLTRWLVELSAGSAETFACI